LVIVASVVGNLFEMPTCASPECGSIGRPFQACGRCKQRRYCGSHCLKPVKQKLFEVLDNNSSSADVSDDVTIEVYPPCMELIASVVNASGSAVEGDENNNS